MLRLHDRTRRRICIGAFCALCIAPTLGVLAWAVAWRLPGHVRAEAERIGRRLGVEVALDDVEHLRPGAVRLVGLTLVDPESGKTIASCDRLDARLIEVESSGAGEDSQRWLVLSAKGANVDTAGLRQRVHEAWSATEARMLEVE